MLSGKWKVCKELQVTRRERERERERTNVNLTHAGKKKNKWDN